MIRDDAARRDPYRNLVAAAIAVGEQNVRVAMDVFGMMTGQTGAARAFVEHSREQQEALWDLAEGSFKACVGLPPNPQTLSRAGSRIQELPVDGFDRLCVEELGCRLEGLCARDVEKLKDHERRTRNRPDVMERLDRALV